MNIFVTDTCPVKSARALDDVRLNKMILESAQMLCTNALAMAEQFDITDSLEQVPAQRSVAGAESIVPYKPTHMNHPCTVWARKSQYNYNWLARHFIALVDEKTDRTHKIHLSYTKLLPLLTHIYGEQLDIPVDNDLSFVYAGDYPVRTVSGLDVIASYRKTMLVKWENDTLKGRPPRWTNTTPVDWYN